MKKALFLLLLVISIITTLTSCDNTKKEITCEDVIKVYEDAGYSVFHSEKTTEEWEWECYVKCTDTDSGEYIFFHFFETNEDAEDYLDKREWNFMLFLFSFIMSEPSWLITKTYNNIEIEYHKNYLYQPFNSLL